MSTTTMTKRGWHTSPACGRALILGASVSARSAVPAHASVDAAVVAYVVDAPRFGETSLIEFPPPQR